MLFGSYLFTGVSDDDAILPEYKGSTLRGVFGHARKRVVCALRRRDSLLSLPGILVTRDRYPQNPSVIIYVSNNRRGKNG
ncbi:MAG: hypothetical protein PHN75_02670 [Syntrophales bacterium]|nr:hypothetical protein [Syntrophales bacterium]